MTATTLETSATSSSSGENFSTPPPAPSSGTAADDDDSLYCILSNMLFISGGICYVAASSWDYSLYAYAASPDDVDITTILTHFTYLLYEALWIMGPLVYFLNSTVDVKWALRARRRYRKRRDAEKLADPSLAGIKERNAFREIYRRVRKNVGSRRALGAASTFGLGAFCGLVGALSSARAANTTLGPDASDGLYARSDMAGAASVHIYLLSAVCALWKTTGVWKNAIASLWNKDGVRWYNNPTSLFTLGDILFGIAAINDVILTDSALDDGYYSLPISSAILWTIDALLYTRGDICVFRLEAAGGGGGGVDTSLSLGNNNDGDVALSPAPPVVVDPENEIV